MSAIAGKLNRVGRLDQWFALADQCPYSTEEDQGAVAEIAAAQTDH
jgi:hypothetical protein